MADKVHRIHSLPDESPWTGGLPPAGSDEHPYIIRMLDRVLAIQRPIVVAHLRSIRLRHPNATTAEIVRILERRYLAAVTTGGAAVGATAVVPGIGTGVTLALSGVETVGFLEATTLFAQSVAEVHGIPVEDPERARALVLALMLGKEGVDLVAQLAGQTGHGGIRVLELRIQFLHRLTERVGLLLPFETDEFTFFEAGVDEPLANKAGDQNKKEK